MPSLRSHTKDPAIGMIGQANCELVADCVAFMARWAAHPLLKWLCPYRKRSNALEMTAATLSRIRGIPEPLPCQFDAQVRIAMGTPNE